MAWVCEAALDDGMVPWIIAEGEGVTDVGTDDGWFENESPIADRDGNVGGEAQRYEREECDGESGMHLKFYLLRTRRIWCDEDSNRKKMYARQETAETKKPRSEGN